MATAIAVLDEVRAAGRRRRRSARSSGASRSSSTPACASSRSTRSCARWRAVGGARARPLRRRRRARTCASATACRSTRSGLTEAQPENNVQRIVLEALGGDAGSQTRARGRSSCPAWNEALGLPRPWDQQWSLRIQQVLAYETDLLEYPRHLRGLEGDGRARRRAARGRARGDGASSRSTAARSRPCRT